jgi:polyhydroxybutyrate depolymerase
LAAVASLSATVAEPYLPLKTGKPVPILLMLSTEDTIVPWEGGSLGTLSAESESFGKLLSGAKSVQFWVDNNHSGKVEHVTKLPDRDIHDETRVTETAYGHGKSEVLFYQLDGGGHSWPGGEQYLPDLVIGPVCRDINGNEVIWNFFKRH